MRHTGEESESRERVLAQLQQFALGQIACGRKEVSAILSRRHFDWVPASEEQRPVKSLPFYKRWRLENGWLVVYTDEPPLSDFV